MIVLDATIMILPIEIHFRSFLGTVLICQVKLQAETLRLMAVMIPVMTFRYLCQHSHL